MAQRGPKKTHYDKTVIRRLITEFSNERNYKGTIKYKDIFDYAKEMLESSKFPYETTYDFWKREGRVGRELVDEYNKIKTKQIVSTDKRQIDIVDVYDVLNKLVSDEKMKEQLGKYLIPLERQVRDFAEQLENKDKKMNVLEEEIKKLKKDKEILKQKINSVQDLNFKLFLYSNSDNEIVNLINTGKSRSYPVNKAIEEVFTSPINFFNELENKKVKKTATNVVEFKKTTDKETTFVDEFDI
jgi:hypothetical protein